MPIGVSTSCLFPMETDAAFLQLAKAGVRDVEVFFNAQCETQGAILQTLCDIRRAYAVNVHAVHTFNAFADHALLFHKYDRRLMDGLELYRGLCGACWALGCDLLVIHGDTAYSPGGSSQRLDDDEFIQRYKLLHDVIRQEGVRLSQENVVRFRSGQIEQLRMLRDAIGENLHMTLDVKQAVRCGLNPLALAEEFADCIAHVHLSDHGAAGDCMLPGRGEFSFPTLFSVLQNADFSGDYVIEVYRAAFHDISELLDSYKFTSDLLAKCTNLK